MAKTATKTVKKVSTAKGKGKAPKAKAVTKKAVPAAKKKPVAKTPTVRKVRTPKIVDPNKYGKFTILDAFNEKYPESSCACCPQRMATTFRLPNSRAM